MSVVIQRFPLSHLSFILSLSLFAILQVGRTLSRNFRDIPLHNLAFIIYSPKSFWIVAWFFFFFLHHLCVTFVHHHIFNLEICITVKHFQERHWKFRTRVLFQSLKKSKKRRLFFRQIILCILSFCNRYTYNITKAS